MSSNTSQRRAQSRILAAPATDYRSWDLIADCGSCGPRRLRLADVAEGTMMGVILRLRCRGCGGRAATAAIENRLAGWQHRHVRIWGPGSFG